MWLVTKIEWRLEALSKLQQEQKSQLVLIPQSYTESKTKQMQCFVFWIVFSLALYSRTWQVSGFNQFIL